VATTLAADGANIAALTCAREKRGGDALLAIELDQPLSEPALNFVRAWAGMAWTRMLPKLMDG
jgi:L-serine dehydratase